ncbi:MAG: hypothetical protein BM485_02885 [Desulfobulbaceae bacterium DB1]|nr:MAG: hypothetical protein BM485_02885 [Desulfobulbaceae bacterium DB1]
MLSRFKPAASRKTLLFAAAFFWTLVGIVLLVRGAGVLLAGSHYLLFGAAFVLGTAKGLLVFQKSAEKNIARILARQEGSCLGAVFSFKAWALILVMIFLGRFLRLVGLSPAIYSLVLVAVGWGLILASLAVWRQWRTLET